MAFTETDRKILKRCLAREPGGWEEFVDRFIGLFMHVIQHTAHSRSVTLSPDDLEDICSEIFLTLLKNDFAVLRHFKGRSSLATYLTVVGRRIAVKAVSERRKSEAMGHVRAHASVLQAAGVEPAPLDRMADAEEVRGLLDQLPAPEAAIVRKFHLEGKTYAQIAQELNIPENSVGPTLSRARERLSRLRPAAETAGA